MIVRARGVIASGALLGAALSLWVWRGADAAVAAGANASGVGFGVSHALFIFSLPWSFLVLIAMWGVAAMTGADGRAFLTPWFYAMPVVAGACWGALGSLVLRSR